DQRARRRERQRRRGHHPLWQRPAGPQARGHSRRRSQVRRLLLRPPRHPQHRPRRLQTELSGEQGRNGSIAGGGDSVQPCVGKYRGTVTDIQDPLFMNRIRAKVPDVMGDQESGWATPCLPFAGSGMGFFALPKVGAGVWIEFEHGDPDYPIWSGCWIGSAADVPPNLIVPVPYKKLMIQTDGGTTVVLDDTPGIGGISLQTANGQKIVLSPTGIVIDNG